MDLPRPGPADDPGEALDREPTGDEHGDAIVGRRDEPGGQTYTATAWVPVRGAS